MSTPDPEPKSALDEMFKIVRDMDFPIEKLESAALELVLLRDDLAAVREERDALAARLAERAKQDDEIYRNAKSILARLHGGLGVNSQPEEVVKTSQV